jgi:Tfp pilus assembly protein PilO
MEEEKIAKRKRKSDGVDTTDEAVNDEQKAKTVRKKAKADLDLEEENVADGRWQKVAGIVFLLLSVIMLVAFSSYLFTLAEDQSDVNARCRLAFRTKHGSQKCPRALWRLAV